MPGRASHELIFLGELLAAGEHRYRTYPGAGRGSVAESFEESGPEADVARGLLVLVCGRVAVGELALALIVIVVVALDRYAASEACSCGSSDSCRRLSSMRRAISSIVSA